MAGALDTLNSSNILPGESGGIPTKAPLSPTDFATVSGPKGSKMALDPQSSEQILANMQKFIDDRQQNATQKFFGGVNEAIMLGRGGPEYNQFIQNKQAQAKDTQEMQLQMAQFKAAQAQHKAFQDFQKQRLDQENKPTPITQSQTQTAPGAQAPATGDTITTTSGQTFKFRDLPPEIRSAVLGQTDYASAQKIIDTWSEKHAETAQKIEGDVRVKGMEYATVKGPNGTEYPTLLKDVPAVLAKLYPNGAVPPEAVSKVAAPEAKVPTAPATVATAALAAPEGRHKGTAADVNNPGGMRDANGFFVYKTPEEGVQAMQNLTGVYLSGEGPMKGITPTIENMTGVWASGNPSNQPPNYVPFVKQELAKAGIKLNADSTVPNTPEANNALTAARIKFESGKNANKFLPLVGQGENPVATVAKAEAVKSAAPVETGTRSQIQSLIDSIPKPHPQAGSGAWDTYRKTIADLTSKLNSAPIENQQAADKITTTSKATNSALNEKAMNDASNMYSTTYKTALDQMEAFANDKRHDPLFAIGNRQNDISKAIALGKHAGLNTEDLKETYKRFSPGITDNDLAGMEQFKKNSQQIVAAYVHQTFPGRILASELQLGAGAKGIGLDSQRLSNAASLASVRTIFELNQKLHDGLSSYRNAPGRENALFDDYVASPEGKQIISQSADDLAKKFPQYFPRADKFAKHKTSGAA